jgi:hypothetical protein
VVEEGLGLQRDQPKDGLLIAVQWLDFATERVPQMRAEMDEGRGQGLNLLRR